MEEQLIRSRGEARLLVGGFGVMALCFAAALALAAFVRNVREAWLVPIQIPFGAAMLGLYVLGWRVRRRLLTREGRESVILGWKWRHSSRRVSWELMTRGRREAARWLGWSRMRLRLFTIAAVGLPAGMVLVFVVTGPPLSSR